MIFRVSDGGFDFIITIKENRFLIDVLYQTGLNVGVENKLQTVKHISGWPPIMFSVKSVTGLDCRVKLAKPGDLL